jgi:hypothetical protein
LAKLEEEENNPMKALENRTVDSKREMDILDALQDIRARNARNERVGQSVDLVERLGLEEIETEEDQQRKLEEDEDEELVRQVFSRVPLAETSSSTPGPFLRPAQIADNEVSSIDIPRPAPQMTVKRKADGQEPEVLALLSESARGLIASKTSQAPPSKKTKMVPKNSLGIKINKSRSKPQT